MVLSRLIRKRMFFLVFLILIIFSILRGYSTIGINRTVGWAWDISNWIFYVKYGTWLLFLIGYGILALLKINTNLSLSILHLISILIILICGEYINYLLIIILSLNLISIIVFFTNIFLSIRHRNKKEPNDASI